MAEQGPAPPPGWYPDPSNPAAQRYWDGRTWAPPTAPWPAAPATPIPRTSGFAIASLILGIFGGVVLALVFGFVARSKIKRSGGALRGQGMATAGIILAFGWLALVVVLGIVGLLGGFDSDNASHYEGEEAGVARVVDDFEEALRDRNGTRVCTTIFTASLADDIQTGSGKACSEFMASVGGPRQVEMTVKRIVIAGDTATVDVDEGGKSEQWRMVRQNGRWYINHLAQDT